MSRPSRHPHVARPSRTRIFLAAFGLAASIACVSEDASSDRTPEPALDPPRPSAAPAKLDDPSLGAYTTGHGPKMTTTALVARPGTGAAIEDERNTMDVFRSVAPATVFITQKRTIRGSYFSAPETVAAGTGTGFIWDRQGHVVTNAHVVSESQQPVVARDATFEVKTYAGDTYDAKLVGYAAEKDIAVLAIQAKPGSLTPVRLPDRKHRLEVGQKTLAIGNPFGLDHTLTTGVISALGRQVKGFGDLTIRDMIQTDASINPGNSGGPLLDSAGQLIGMNTMIYSRSGSSAGIGFAVPVTTIRRLVGQILRYGHPRRVGLGIDIAPDHIARQLGAQGVIVRYVHPRSPAAKAGLQSVREDRRRGQITYDLIVAIDGADIRSYDDLYGALDPHDPGDEVTITVRRGSGTFQSRVKLVDLDTIGGTGRQSGRKRRRNRP